MPDGENSNTDFSASLPEAIRGHEAFVGVKDAGDLATRYVSAITPKPFAETLPKDIAGEAVFKDLKDLDGLARSYHGQAKLLGVPKDQLLRVPTDDKPESWDPIYNKLGRPEKPDAYKLTLPEGAKLNEELAKPLFETAHKLGVSQKQLDGLYGALAAEGQKQNVAATAKATADQAAAAQALKTEFGMAYDQKIATAVAAVAHLDKTLGLNGQLAKDLEATGLGNHPGLAKVFAHLGSSLREDGLIGKASGTDQMSSPTEAKQNIAALQQDTNFMAAYMDKRHTGHSAAMAKMSALYAQANPQMQ